MTIAVDLGRKATLQNISKVWLPKNIHIFITKCNVKDVHISFNFVCVKGMRLNLFLFWDNRI